MSDMKKPVAIIPARGGSKRFPRKNVALLDGKPLVGWAIDVALESGVFDEVCVSTEDEQTIRIASQYEGATVRRRPAELAEDRVTLREVCAHVLKGYADEGRPFAEFGLLLPTSPLRLPEDLRESYRIFRESGADFCMSLVPVTHPPQRSVRIDHGYVRPFLGIESMKQTQLLEPLYRHDGSIIFARSDNFLSIMEFYGEKVVPYMMPEERSVDIDTPLDLAWAEFLLSMRKNVAVRPA